MGIRIKQVSIQINQSLICGGCAIIEDGGVTKPIFFDVVKSEPIAVIVGSRGKKDGLTVEEADLYEKELLKLFIQRKVPLTIGKFTLSA